VGILISPLSGSWLALTLKALLPLRLWRLFRVDNNVHMSARFEAYFVAIFVFQGVLDADLSILIVGAFDCNLCFVRVARMWRINSRFDDSGYADARRPRCHHSID
jgi:hypothetical protein